MKKNGFISVSVIYTFLISFLLILSIILATYVSNRANLNKYRNQIKYCDLCSRSNGKCDNDTYTSTCNTGG